MQMTEDVAKWPLDRVVQEFQRVFPDVELGWINGQGMREVLAREKFVARGPRISEYRLVTAVAAKDLGKGWKIVHRDPCESAPLRVGGLDFLFMED